MSSLSRFQTTTNSLLNWVFQDKDAVIKGKPSFVFDMFADHLSAAYEEWLPFKKKENLKLVKNYLIFLIIIQVKKNHLLIFI